MADLRGALSRTETRTEAVEIIRELIERIDAKADGAGHVVQLTGDIVKLITLPDEQDVPDAFESSVKVVAGARNRIDRLWGVPGLVAHKAHRYQSLRC